MKSQMKDIIFVIFYAFDKNNHKIYIGCLLDVAAVTIGLYTYHYKNSVILVHYSMLIP